MKHVPSKALILKLKHVDDFVRYAVMTKNPPHSQLSEDVLISPLEIDPVLMFRGTSAGGRSGNWLEARLFNTDSKCISIAVAGLPFTSRLFHLHF